MKLTGLLLPNISGSLLSKFSSFNSWTSSIANIRVSLCMYSRTARMNVVLPDAVAPDITIFFLKLYCPFKETFIIFVVQQIE